MDRYEEEAIMGDRSVGWNLRTRFVGVRLWTREQEKGRSYMIHIIRDLTGVT